MAPSVPKPAQGFEMIKLASAALAVKAVNTVSNAMTTARTALASIDTTTKTAVLSLDRFRMGLAAPAVNPALNTLPGLIQKISGGVAGAVESFRGFGDATIAGAPAIMTAIAGGMQRVLGSGDSLQATVSKITAQFDLQRGALDRVAAIYPTTGTAVGMLKDAMNFIAPAAEKVAQKVDEANASVREAAISARNLAFIATGSFIQTGTSADTYARGAYHAMLPTRLMAFEAKFAAGSMGLVRSAFAAVTAPIHSVQMAIQRTSGEFRELRANLPPLTGTFRAAIATFRSAETANISLGAKIRWTIGFLQLGTRAMRVFAHATYLGSREIDGLKRVATPITFVATKLWGLVRPAKAATVGLDGVTVAGHKAGFVLRGVTRAADGTFQSLKKVASESASMGSNQATGFLSALPNMARMGTIALAGLAAGAIAMGSNFAMATEKNQAVFGVMLKDMDQGRAVVASLQGSAAVGLFDNEEVLNSGRLLFKAGVAAVDLSAKTDQLATIAAATSTELGDLTRIYQQGANRGSFGQDKINQLAERGIDIYHALEATTGASGAALADMISGGKIGITEMDAALAHLTEGNGIYAGSLEMLAGTTSGMLAQIKNNLMQALGGMGAVGNDAFKPVLSAILAMSEGVKTSIGAVAPIVTQLFMTIQAAFTGIWSVVTATFTGIFGAGAATFGSLLEVTMSWVTKFKWFFTSIVPIIQFTGLSMTSIMVTAFNDVAYWVTDTMPAYLTWFGENWISVFRDIGSGTATIFTNLTANIGNAMRAIWNFIKSGGTADLELAWTPLLTGFQATVAALPDVPERALTALEESLQQSTQQIGTELADSFDALNMEAQASLTLTPPEMPEIDPSLSGAMNTGEGEDAAGRNQRTNFAVTGLERGSEAALNAIFNAQKDKTPQQQLGVLKKIEGHMAKAAAKPSPMVLGGV
jgi:tape measure domain-containing protein